MDSRLNERLHKWDLQIEEVSKVEEEFFVLEGTEKSLEGQLFLESPGRTIDEKKSCAYDSKEWREFKKALAEKKSRYNKERRILDLRIKAYEAEYLTYKIESEIIHKGKGGQVL